MKTRYFEEMKEELAYHYYYYPPDKYRLICHLETVGNNCISVANYILSGNIIY